MSNRIIELSSAAQDESSEEQARRSLFDRIFLGILVWGIPLVLASIFLSGSLPGRQVSSAEDTFSYIVKRVLESPR